MANPAVARPEIASGDRLLSTNFDGCIARSEAFIESLGVQSDSGTIDRTGYFEDGSFRLLCYGTGEDSLVVIFATHNASLDVATNFVQMALDRMSEEDASISRSTPPTPSDSHRGASSPQP